MGRAFGLRRRGRLEEALAVCREAMRIARPVDLQTASTSSFGTLVIGALTIYEISSRLGQSEVAREPLETALRLLESANRDARRPSEELIRTEREVRAKLDQLRAVG